MRSAAVLALGLAVSATTLAGQQLVATERAEVVATIWAEARYNFAYWDRVRADWDSALGANLKLAAEPQSDLAFYRRLRRLLAVLGDGNAAVTLPPYLRSRLARPPLRLETVERRPFTPPELELDSLPGGVAVVRVNSLADEEVARRFDRAFPDFARVTGLILDLRAAAGGRSEFGYQILARLEDKPFLAARWKTPE